MKLKNAIEDYILHAATIQRRFATRLPAIYPLGSVDANKNLDGIYYDGTLDCLTLPLSQACGFPGTVEKGWEGITIRHMRQAPAKATRGLPLRGRYFAKETYRGISNSRRNEALSCDLYYASMDGKNWRCCNKHGVDLTTKVANDDYHDYGIKAADNASSMVGLACGLQTFREYSWHIQFQFDSEAAPIIIAVDRKSLRYALRLRDVPEGKKRRAAALHLVSAHKRELEDKEIDVRLHIRGAVCHLWQGCSMKVLPPVNDLKGLKRSEKTEEVALHLLQNYITAEELV